jgi:integrase
VPLSGAAIAVVERVGVKAGLLFPSAHHSSLAEAHGRDDITVHGFRSCFKTWGLERTSVKREIIEIAMSHRIGDTTEESYIDGDALEQRRPLMNAWAEF